MLTCACGRGQGSDMAQGGKPACDDAGFLRLQSGFADGSLSGDQLVDICGRVSSVGGARYTRSGRHGYFLVEIPGSVSQNGIEIVANLDAMAESSSDDPPVWPWVAEGDYVYVQGRYYYDSPLSQGIDWTENDTDRNWPHPGYVVVCDAQKARCNKYM